MDTRTNTARRIVLPIIFLVFALGIIYYTMTFNQVSCTVCIEYQGSSACRTASGATREEAIRTAIDNACAQVTTGMGNIMICSQSEPAQVECTPDGG